MHGTGTPLGDPIEAGAAATALMLMPTQRPQRRSETMKGMEPSRGLIPEQGPGSRLKAPLAFASDKSALGHTEPAAGEVVEVLVGSGWCLVFVGMVVDLRG